MEAQKQKLKRTQKEISKPEDFTDPEVLYNRLITTIREYHPSTDLSMVEKAYKLARDAHKDQKRKSGEPYIIHPLAVAEIVAEIGLDSDAIAAALPELGGAQDAAMVGYRLKNTVSPFGTVTRGVCATQDGLLRKVQETYKIRLCPDGLIRDMSGEGEGIVLDPEALVSMNLWGYHPQMLDVMAQYFDDFVHTLTPGDEKRECLLPVMMDALTAQSRVRTRVLQTDEHWFGLTYQDDKPGVVAALRALHADGTYPPALWK